MKQFSQPVKNFQGSLVLLLTPLTTKKKKKKAGTIPAVFLSSRLGFYGLRGLEFFSSFAKTLLLLRIFLICPGWNQEPTLIQKRKSQSQTVSTYHHRYSCYSNWGFFFFTFFFGCFKRWGRVMQC